MNGWMNELNTYMLPNIRLIDICKYKINICLCGQLVCLVYNKIKVRAQTGQLNHTHVLNRIQTQELARELLSHWTTERPQNFTVIPPFLRRTKKDFPLFPEFLSGHSKILTKFWVKSIKRIPKRAFLINLSWDCAMDIIKPHTVLPESVWPCLARGSLDAHLWVVS